MLLTSGDAVTTMAAGGPHQIAAYSYCNGVAGQRQFKKHKVLPKPRHDRTDSIYPVHLPSQGLLPDLTIDTTQTSTPTASQPSSPPTLRHASGNLIGGRGGGPELPPTPPAHPRTSSSSHSTLPSFPTTTDSRLLRTPKQSAQAPTTPPDQRSPPTPDVTPPQPVTRPMALRPLATAGVAATDRGVPVAPARRSATDTTDATYLTIESRTESFRTAREDPPSSPEENVTPLTVQSQLKPQPAAASGRTSRSAVPKVPPPNGHGDRVPNPLALGMALSRLAGPVDEHDDAHMPRKRHEPLQFDGDWGSVSGTERPSDRAQVTVAKTRQQQLAPDHQHQYYRHQRKMSGDAPLQEPANPVAASSAVRTVRNASLTGKASPKSSSRSGTDRATRSSSGPTYSDSSVATSQQRSSGLSSMSFSSKVSALVDAPYREPQKQRTLRHVRKQGSLREPMNLSMSSVRSAKQSSPAAVTAPVVERGRKPSRPPITNQRPTEPGRNGSHASVSSVSSARARREVWKSGAIPVIVVPDRLSSRSKSREPSLRSTSSRHSRRTQSLGSNNPHKDVPPVAERRHAADPALEHRGRLSRSHSRSYSLSSSSSDVMTMDFPPAIPRRSSSLSAPTSRNVSRAGSMTTESLRHRDNATRPLATRSPPRETASRDSPRSDPPQSQPSANKAPQSEEWPLVLPSLSPPLSPPPPLHQQQTSRKLASPLLLDPIRLVSDLHHRVDGGGDYNDGLSSPSKIPSRNTPFSVASMETNGTAPEVSEAQAVHMYHHQNSSVLMVDHSARLSDVSDSQRTAEAAMPATTGAAAAPNDNSGPPSTPMKAQFSLDDIESPLRNPRAPPEPPTQVAPTGPPVLTFTSATPSGTTPALDKEIQRGNLLETMAEDPNRKPSLVARAFGRRHRNSLSYPPNASRPGGSFLSRAFSLPSRNRSHSRNRSRSRSRSRSRRRRGRSWSASGYPLEDDVPPEENRLHPFWRPQWDPDDDDDDDDDDDIEYERVFDDDDDDEEVEESEQHLRYPPIDNRPTARAVPKRRFSDKMKRTFSVLPSREVDTVTMFHDDDAYGTEKRTIQRTSSGNLRVMRRRSSGVCGNVRPSTAPDGGDSSNRNSIWRGISSVGPDGVSRPPLSSSSAAAAAAAAQTRSSSHRRRFSLSDKVGDIQDIPRRLSDRRREKRTEELRKKISGPKEVHDGVDELLRRSSVSQWGT